MTNTENTYNILNNGDVIGQVTANNRREAAIKAQDIVDGMAGISHFFLALT